MGWHAKPSGGYSVGSSEWVGNYNEIYNYMHSRGWTDEAIAGLMGNIQAESGFNPWRWQGDTVSGGYGLVQWTPASGYINLSGTTPNMSTSHQTAGATPEDGERQCQAIDENNPAKWTTYGWRSYWSKVEFYDLWVYSREVVSTWGTNGRITYSDFKHCTDVDAACFMFNACFEGEGVPNQSTRTATAQYIYQTYMGGVVPPTPTPPPPTPTPSGQLNPLLIAILKKAIEWRILT